MTRSIHIEFQTPQRERLRGRDTFRIVATVVSAEEMPREIFGHQRSLVDPYNGKFADEFAFICSAWDLSIYPANEPLATQVPAFFRKRVIDVLVPSVTLAEEFIATVQSQVATLVTTMNQLDQLATTQSFWYPAPPEEPSSESSEESL